MGNSIFNTIMDTFKNKGAGTGGFTYSDNEIGLKQVRIIMDTTVVPLYIVKDALLGKEVKSESVHLIVKSNAVSISNERLLESVTPIINAGLEVLHCKPKEFYVINNDKVREYLYGYEEQLTKERRCCIHINFKDDTLDALVEYKSRVVDGVEQLQEVEIILVLKDMFLNGMYSKIKNLL